MLTAQAGGRVLRHEFHGRVDGDTITGKVKLSDGGESDWTAMRTRRGRIKLSGE
jgi:hypothetical protein